MFPSLCDSFAANLEDYTSELFPKDFYHIISLHFGLHKISVLKSK